MVAVSEHVAGAPHAVSQAVVELLDYSFAWRRCCEERLCADHGHGGVRVDVGAVTELPGVVTAPTFDGGVSEQRARMAAHGTDLGGAGDPGDGDGCVRVDVGAVTEFPPEVVAPALDGGVSEQRARIADTCADLGGAGDAGDGDGCVRVDVGAVTEGPSSVRAPTFDSGVRK